MEAFSIFKVPKYQQKKLFDSALGVSVDYKRFNIRDRKLLDGILLASHKADNITNTNVAYDWQIAYIRVNSPRGVAHQVVASFEEVWPVPFAYIEIYWLGQWLRWAVARIDFYGAFFHFFDDLPQRYKNLYEHLIELSKNEDKKVWCTRIDIAIDFNYAFPQKWSKWFHPAKNSQREVSSWEHHWLLNSVAYLAEKNTWYGVRMYDKNVQVRKKKKESWYGGEDKMPNDWTRIEFEFYNPYSSMEESKLIDLCTEHILWRKVNLEMVMRPNYTFNIENAYTYFERYAKNHWLSMDQLVKEIVKYHAYILEKKELYWLVDEKI